MKPHIFSSYAPTENSATQSHEATLSGPHPDQDNTAASSSLDQLLHRGAPRSGLSEDLL